MCVLDSYNDCKFGTFLYNCEKDRVKNGVYMRTESLWQHVMANKKEFVEPFFKEKNEMLVPNTASHAILLWDEYYRRRDLNRNKGDVWELLRELAVKNNELETSLKSIKKRQLDTLLDSPQVVKMWEIESDFLE